MNACPGLPRSAPKLATPFALRGLTLRNRIVMSPMCQYCAQDGRADDWHLVHLGSRAVGGAGLIMVEATAVTPQGRITPGCLGLWDDGQIEPLARIARFVRAQGGATGVQLAHAGRKGSCAPSWQGGAPLMQGGWPVLAPSPVPFDSRSPVPHAATAAELHGVVAAFGDAARRAVRAGTDLVEIHAAHGYLLHSFLSALSNQRRDEWGGSLQGRMRLTLEVAAQVRRVLPDSMPLGVRISATDWSSGGWDVAQSIELALRLRGLGVDFIDVSSGGLLPDATIPQGPGYQVPFARQIRQACGLPVGAVGWLTDPVQAENILGADDADLVFVGRELLRNPYWAYQSLVALGAQAADVPQYRSARAGAKAPAHVDWRAARSS